MRIGGSLLLVFGAFVKYALDTAKAGAAGR